MKCTHWIGAEGRYCRADGARRYANSTACPAHTPNALRGLPEPPPGPEPTPRPEQETP